MNIQDHETQPSFEEVYPQAPFSELIRLSIMLAEWLRGTAARRQRRQRIAAAESVSTGAPPPASSAVASARAAMRTVAAERHAEKLPC